MKNLTERTTVAPKPAVGIAHYFEDAKHTLKSTGDGLSLAVIALRAIMNDRPRDINDDALRGVIDHLYTLRDEYLLAVCDQIGDAAKAAGVVGFKTFTEE